MSRTRTQLANRALDKLFMVGAGQSPDAEDTEKVDDVIDSFAEFISQADIYTIADLDAIDEAQFEPLAMLLAWFCAPDFKKPQDQNIFNTAKFMLDLINSTGPTYEPLATDHF